MATRSRDANGKFATWLSCEHVWFLFKWQFEDVWISGYEILQHARYLLHVPESSRPKPLTRASVSEFCFRNNSLVKATIFPRPFQFYHLWNLVCVAWKHLEGCRGRCGGLVFDMVGLKTRPHWMWTWGRNNQFSQGWFAYFALKFPRFNTGTGGGCHWCVQRLWYSQPLKIIQVNQPSPLWENNGKHTWSLKLKVFHHWKLE